MILLIKILNVEYFAEKSVQIKEERLKGLAPKVLEFAAFVNI